MLEGILSSVSRTPVLKRLSHPYKIVILLAMSLTLAACRTGAPTPAPALPLPTEQFTPAAVRPATATPWPTGLVVTAAPLEPTLPFAPTWTPARVTPIAELKGLGVLLFQCRSGPLCLMNADGTDLRQITPDRYAMPRWSPDGQVFVA